MQYRHEITYDAPAPAVYAMLLDPEFQDRRSRLGNPEHAEAVVSPGPGDGSTVTVTRRLAVDLPGFVQRLTGRTVTLDEELRWPDGAGADGARTGSLRAAIAGQPADVAGTLRVATASSDRTVVTMAADITVRVPLVGGKIERFVAEMLDKLMRAEQDLGRRWLAAGGKSA